MTTFAKSTAPILATLALCLWLPGKAGAQAAPAAQPANPVQAAKPATVTPAKPVAKPVAQAKPVPQANHMPGAVPASPAKPVPAKPAMAASAAAKPVSPKPVAVKPVAVKPVQVKPIVVKPVQVRPIAKPAIVKPAAPAKPVSPVASNAKPAVKPVEKPVDTKVAAEPAAPEAAATDTLIAKRDPFISPLASKASGGSGPVLPPGKAGLVVATVRIDGTVRSGDGMIAMVSNPEKHVYFVREGDRLYDGDVESINLDGVTFRENSKDAFGKPVERMVSKRIYQSAGESQ